MQGNQQVKVICFSPCVDIAYKWLKYPLICLSRLDCCNRRNSVEAKWILSMTELNSWSQDPLSLYRIKFVLINIHTFSFKRMHLKMSSAKWRPFCLGPNVSRQNASIHNCLMSERMVFYRNDGFPHGTPYGVFSGTYQIHAWMPGGPPRS